MSRRYRITLSAIGLAALLAAVITVTLLSHEPVWAVVFDQANSDNNTGRLDQPQPADTLALPQVDYSNCDASDQECRETRELVAQEGMNRATGYMVWLSGGGLCVAGIGTFLLYLTWRETQRVTEETRRIGEAQTRAYVGVAELGVRFDEDRDLVVCPVFRNSGQSPALNTHYRVTVSYGMEIGETPVTKHSTEPVPLGHIPSAQERRDPLVWDNLSPPESFFRLLLSEDHNNGYLGVSVYTTFCDVFGARYTICSLFHMRPYGFELDGDFEEMTFVSEQDADVCPHCREEHQIRRFDSVSQQPPQKPRSG